jgi:hypothetical protein
VGDYFQDESHSFIAIHRKQIVRAVDDDHNWFENNPERRFRLRKLIPFEFNSPTSRLADGWSWRVLVDQNLAGARVRIPVWVPVLLPHEGAEDEHLTAIYGLLSSKTLDHAAEATEALRDLV